MTGGVGPSLGFGNSSNHATLGRAASLPISRMQRVLSSSDPDLASCNPASPDNDVTAYSGRCCYWWLYTHTHTHPFNGPLSGTALVSRYQKGKTNLDFTEARDSAWQWHHLGHMQVCISLQPDNHTSTPLLWYADNQKKNENTTVISKTQSLKYKLITI